LPTSPRQAESRLLPGRVHAHAETNRFISVHFTTIFRELERIGLNYKKLKRIAKERNEILHVYGLVFRLSRPTSRFKVEGVLSVHLS
jgi:23S rRNA maturation-related 3'-5' exoribonuclease YhaM